MDLNFFAILYEENLVAEILRKENPKLYQTLYEKIKK